MADLQLDGFAPNIDAALRKAQLGCIAAPSMPARTLREILEKQSSTVELNVCGRQFAGLGMAPYAICILVARWAVIEASS